ncbi:MAG TPA: glycosyltransferase [Solirubrobacterales bacterium]|nr:glycosyltransferase [Solirubrobacterales bacterium]
MKTWIFTPVYKDVRSFRILRERLLEVLAAEAAEVGGVRFVVIDDTAGQDPEVDSLEELEDVVVLRPPFNLGHQRALVYALRKALPAIADEDAIVTLDADGEDRPEDLPRLLRELQAKPAAERSVVLALRTKRRESLGFKILYRGFRLLFRSLTGATVRSGNFAAMPGSIARRALLHPTFDLSYSSAILALDLPIRYVPCERGERYEGRSKMTYGKLAMHGLRMLMPFTDRIAIRALGTFVFFGVLGTILAAIVIFLKLFTGSTVPGWTSYIALGALIVSLVALGNFVSLFVLFSQTRAVSLANIEEIDAGTDPFAASPEASLR